MVTFLSYSHGPDFPSSRKEGTFYRIWIQGTLGGRPSLTKLVANSSHQIKSTRKQDNCLKDVLNI